MRSQKQFVIIISMPKQIDVKTMVINMKPTFKYMTAASKEVIGQYGMDDMMQISFSVDEGGDVNLCFGDSIKIDDPYQLQQMTEYAYPNNAEVLHSKHGLWLSMFIRHMDDFSVMEVELEE
jgi:hypothetical protein